MSDFNPNGGSFSPVRIDRIALTVSEEQIDAAIRCSSGGAKKLAQQLRSPLRRRQARTNIAIGIACGAYHPEDRTAAVGRPAVRRKLPPLTFPHEAIVPTPRPRLEFRNGVKAAASKGWAPEPARRARV